MRQSQDEHRSSALHDSPAATDEPWQLTSRLDQSVNFVRPSHDGGRFEARYVRRQVDYVVVYLSSHSGCHQACRFCHLTASRQTMMSPASATDFLVQADDVLAHYDTVIPVEGRASRVHFNWMARGEPLASPIVLTEFHVIETALAARAIARGLKPRFNVSTILPKSFARHKLEEVLRSTSEEIVIYYSLYSLNESFRRKWLPTALPAEDALARLAAYQRATQGKIVLHWAYIAGENDEVADAERIAETVCAHGIQAKFNLIRYNPYSDTYGQEATEATLLKNFDIISRTLGAPGSRIVTRVGFDVKASCGMFTE